MSEMTANGGHKSRNKFIFVKGSDLLRGSNYGLPHRLLLREMCRYKMKVCIMQAREQIPSFEGRFQEFICRIHLSRSA